VKDWSGNKKTRFVTIGASNHVEHERQLDDYYATDPISINGLFSKIHQNLSNNIWECACGEGHMSKRMSELFPDKIVRSSDLVDRGYPCEVLDFLTYNKPDSFNGDIITNPPYKYAQQFVEKAIETVVDKKLVCMFLKLTFLEGQKRKKMFEKYPPKLIYVFSSRVKCALNGRFEGVGSSAVAYAWFIWEKGWFGKPTIEWI
jgi:hypothetical protein